MESEYEVVLVGTNLVLSILAAALARAGKRVLCLDDANTYGGEFATLSLKEMQEFMSAAGLHDNDDESTFPGSSNGYFALGKPTMNEQELAKYRQNDFGFDLTSKLVFSRGLSVDVLAESGVARYVEFQICEACYFYDGNSIQAVPHSKTQVFTSTELTMLEKRQLMRFLQFASDFSSQEKEESWINDRAGAAAPGRSLVRPQNKTSDAQELIGKVSNEISLNEFLQQHVRMTSGKLRSIIEHCVAESVPQCEFAMHKVSRYIKAMGRFGTTPFLHPSYGVSELCQAFSRMCSVYGGTCALRMKPTSLSLQGELVLQDGTQVKSTICTIVQASYLPPKDGMTNKFDVRMVCVTKQSLLPAGKSFLVVPPQDDAAAAVFVVQQDYTSKVVPLGLLTLHLSTTVEVVGDDELQQLECAKQRLQELCCKLTMKEDEVYTAAFAKQRRLSSHGDKMYIVGDEDKFEMEIDASFHQAKELFTRICPNDAFLPASESELRAREEERLANAANVMPGTDGGGGGGAE